MKHTECKDCELSNGDCGYHFKMDGITNYDIASLSACDQYGNCEFFKQKAKPKGDLISREALKKKLQEHHDFFVNAWGGFKNLPPNDKARVDEITNCISEVVNAPTVEDSDYYTGYQDGLEEGYLKGVKVGNDQKRKICDSCKIHERPQGEWKFKKFDEETGISNSDWCPFCGKAKAQVYDKFCGNCGAQLRR